MLYLIIVNNNNSNLCLDHVRGENLKQISETITIHKHIFKKYNIRNIAEYSANKKDGASAVQTAFQVPT